MAWIAHVLLLFLIFYQVAANSRIIGGEDGNIRGVSNQVSLRYKVNATAAYMHRCAGVIYTSRVVLTTAICVLHLEIQRLQVIAGDSYRTGSKGSVYRVERIIVQNDFDVLFMDNDLALVVLDHEIHLKEHGISSAQISSEQPIAGSSATIAGWGATVEANASELLQLAKVQIVDIAQCRLSYGQARITESMLCAGSFKTSQVIDACQGDAGGALVVNGAAVGLVSWGSGCGRPNFPGVYTNLVHLKSWIEEQVAMLAFKIETIIK